LRREKPAIWEAEDGFIFYNVKTRSCIGKTEKTNKKIGLAAEIINEIGLFVKLFFFDG
jgi:hypothetical protein